MATGDITDELTTTVRYRLAEPTAATWLDADIWSYLSEAQLTLCKLLSDVALSPWISQGASTTLVGAQDTYALPTDFLRLSRVLYKTIPAYFWPTVDIAALRANPIIAPTEAQPIFTIWKENIVFPFTVTQTNGETFEIHYIKKTGDLEGVAGSSAADPELPFYDIMETLAVARCREQAETYQEAQRQYADFLESIELINDRFRGTKALEGVQADINV